MKEFFVAEDGMVIVCSHISAIMVDETEYETRYDNGKVIELNCISALLDGQKLYPLTSKIPREECDVRLKQLTDDIFEVDLPGYPTHGGHPPGGPLYHGVPLEG